MRKNLIKSTGYPPLDYAIDFGGMLHRNYEELVELLESEGLSLSEATIKADKLMVEHGLFICGSGEPNEGP